MACTGLVSSPPRQVLEFVEQFEMRDLRLATAGERIRPKSKRDAVHADVLDAHVARLFLRRGWHAAKPDISGLIGL